MRKEIGRLVGPKGLSVAQYTTLSILRSRSGLSNAQLARRLWVTPQSMNEVISALERAGLIERVPDVANRRILRTALTRDTAGRRSKPATPTSSRWSRRCSPPWPGCTTRSSRPLESCVQDGFGERRTDGIV